MIHVFGIRLMLGSAFPLIALSMGSRGAPETAIDLVGAMSPVATFVADGMVLCIYGPLPALIGERFAVTQLATAPLDKLIPGTAVRAETIVELSFAGTPLAVLPFEWDPERLHATCGQHARADPTGAGGNAGKTSDLVALNDTFDAARGPGIERKVSAPLEIVAGLSARAMPVTGLERIVDQDSLCFLMLHRGPSGTWGLASHLKGDFFRLTAFATEYDLPTYEPSPKDREGQEALFPAYHRMMMSTEGFRHPTEAGPLPGERGDRQRASPTRGRGVAVRPGALPHRLPASRADRQLAGRRALARCVGRDAPRCAPCHAGGALEWRRAGATIIVHRGRVKSGLAPPVLVGGTEMALDDLLAEFLPGEPSPLPRRYAVGPPLLGALNPDLWPSKAPEVGTREPLRVSPPQPIDLVSLAVEAVSVLAEEGKRGSLTLVPKQP